MEEVKYRAQEIENDKNLTFACPEGTRGWVKKEGGRALASKARIAVQFAQFEGDLHRQNRI